MKCNPHYVLISFVTIAVLLCTWFVYAIHGITKAEAIWDALVMIVLWFVASYLLLRKDSK